MATLFWTEGGFSSPALFVIRTFDRIYGLLNSIRYGWGNAPNEFAIYHINVKWTRIDTDIRMMTLSRCSTVVIAAAATNGEQQRCMQIKWFIYNVNDTQYTHTYVDVVWTELDSTHIWSISMRTLLQAKMYHSLFIHWCKNIVWFTENKR